MGKYETFLNEIATQLDLTETEFNTITKSYQAVGNFLVANDNLLYYSPEVFPQGSMRLGTVVKPLKRDDYDIDLVCELTKNKSMLTPNEVKRLVGSALKSGLYASQLEREHGRCWTLDYSANPPYHIDILPGVSIDNSNRVKATIKTKDNNYIWLYTNPKDFADWFTGVSRKKLVFDESGKVEQVKKYNNKTPLQRAVQLIKRHRDVYYQDNPDLGPASVIITALMGLSHNGETTIEDILRNNPISWVSHIKKKNGKYSIKIPSLPDDDYADKWNGEDPGAADRFFEWHSALIADLDCLFRQRDIKSFLKVASKMFDQSSVDRISNTNATIIDSLTESFSRERQLPVPLEDTHPLFKHAKGITSKHPYVPKPSINFYIYGKVYSNEEQANKNINSLSEFYSNSPLLGVGLGLRFTAVVEHYSNYTIIWQVTNTGTEAKNLGNNGLRGDFYDCEPGFTKTRIEQTSYAGSHFVQAFLIDKSTNCCVRKSNILTINIGVHND